MSSSKYNIIKQRLIKLVETAKSRAKNELEIWVNYYPYEQMNFKVFSVNDIDKACKFIRNQDNWYITIYEDCPGRNYKHVLNLTMYSEEYE